MLKVSNKVLKTVKECFEERIACELKSPYSTMPYKDDEGVCYFMKDKKEARASAVGWGFAQLNLDLTLQTRKAGFEHFIDVYERYNGNSSQTKFALQSELFAYFAFADAKVLAKYSKPALKNLEEMCQFANEAYAKAQGDYLANPGVQILKKCDDLLGENLDLIQKTKIKEIKDTVMRTQGKEIENLAQRLEFQKFATATFLKYRAGAQNLVKRAQEFIQIEEFENLK